MCIKKMRIKLFRIKNNKSKQVLWNVLEKNVLVRFSDQLSVWSWVEFQVYVWVHPGSPALSRDPNQIVNL